jgi:hypothetical protein
MLAEQQLGAMSGDRRVRQQGSHLTCILNACLCVDRNNGRINEVCVSALGLSIPGRLSSHLPLADTFSQVFTHSSISGVETVVNASGESLLTLETDIRFLCAMAVSRAIALGC